MNNLEQVRATAALQFWAKAKEATGENGGDVVRSLSALIINNGLLATLAFAIDKGKGHEELMQNICDYLSQTRGVFKTIFRPGEKGLAPYLAALSDGTSTTLQHATDETLAYLTYLKRLRKQ